MVKKLLIAAGGGGDAFTAGFVSRVMADSENYMASFSWDRKMYDPDPGPRNKHDFDDIEYVGKYNAVVSARSHLSKTGSVSFLPKISEYYRSPYYLLELDNGVKYLHDQIEEIINLNNIDEVLILDIGGDILAKGNEQTLKSPIADCSVLAACYGLAVPVNVAVAGLGLDGELNVSQLERLIEELKPKNKYILDGSIVSTYLPAFDWLPSEASALFFLSIKGERGICEIRQDGYTVELNDLSATMFEFDFGSVFQNSIIASALINTDSLLQIEEIVRSISGVSELDIERKKRQALREWEDSRSDTELYEELKKLSQEKVRSGIDYMTRRRLCEILKLKGKRRDDFMDLLRSNYSDRFVSTVWKCK